MKVCFFYSEKEREIKLRDVFLDGVSMHGDETMDIQINGKNEVGDDYDVAVMFGVKSKDLFWAHKKAGKPVIMLDKGYVRTKNGNGMWEYVRVAVNDHHPTDYIAKAQHSSHRFRKLGLAIKPWREECSQGRVIIAGSSAKYHDFYDLPDPTEYTTSILPLIREVYRNREICYRPKPSWRDAVPIPGAVFCNQSKSLGFLLNNAHVLITHGSNACFEAMLAGVPCIILGNAVAKPISSVGLTTTNLLFPDEALMHERRQLLSNLAYCQWTQREFKTGEAWSTIRPQVEELL